MLSYFSANTATFFVHQWLQLRSSSRRPPRLGLPGTQHRIPLFWPRGCSCLLTILSRTFCWDIQMLVLCLHKLLDVISGELVWFFLLIVAVCSARHSGALIPFLSAFGGMSGDGKWAPCAVWGSGVRREPWFWKALAQPGLFGQTWWFGHSSNIHMQWFFFFSWFTMLKLKTTWL